MSEPCPPTPVIRVETLGSEIEVRAVTPGAVRVLGPFDGTPIRFRDATVTPALGHAAFASS